VTVKISYFRDTDTLYIELSEKLAVETQDLDDNTLIDLDAHGNVCALTLEHASERFRPSSAPGESAPE
jgi:uncharacterized protein YuzE